MPALAGMFLAIAESNPGAAGAILNENVPVLASAFDCVTRAFTFECQLPRPASNVDSSVESKFGGVVSDVPPGVVTVTATVPDPAGAVAVIDASLLKVKLVAFVPPNFTEVTPVKPEPLIVTVLPPAAGPCDGTSEVTIGAYVN